MKTTLRMGALTVAVVGLALWFFGGMNLGWTKTKVAVMQKDEVTGIEFPVYENRFLPGVDFLGATALGAMVLWFLSWVVGKRSARVRQSMN